MHTACLSTVHATKCSMHVSCSFTPNSYFNKTGSDSMIIVPAISVLLLHIY